MDPCIGRPCSMQGSVFPWSSSGSSGHKGGIEAPDVGGGDGSGAMGLSWSTPHISAEGRRDRRKGMRYVRMKGIESGGSRDGRSGIGGMGMEGMEWKEWDWGWRWV